MKTLLNGTSVELIANWIHAIEKDIKEKKFYCLKCSGDTDYLCISSLNKARLLVMYEIFHISSNDYAEGQSNYFKAYKGSVAKTEETMMDYLETMKLLLEIK